MPGRGGAGNILAAEQQKARVTTDVEASRQQETESNSVPIDRTEQQYAYSGRGGAGNWYSPKELSQTGHFSDAHRSHVLGDGTQAPVTAGNGNANGVAPPSYNAVQTSSAPTRTVGRGGAGNYMYGASESEEQAARRRADEEQTRKQLQEDVEKNVQSVLAEPPKARLAGREPF